MDKLDTRRVPITRHGVAAAVADGTLRIEHGRLLFDSDAAEQLASRQTLLAAECDRKALAQHMGRHHGKSAAGMGSYDAYRNPGSPTGPEYIRLLDRGIRSAARLGLDNAQIARWLDVVESQVAWRWTSASPDSQRQVRELLGAGHSARETARRVGLDRKTCRKLGAAEGIAPTDYVVPKHVRVELDRLLAQGIVPSTAHSMILDRWPEMDGVLTLGNVRVRKFRLGQRTMA